MWPDDYIAWAQAARPIVLRGLKRLMNRHLHTNPQWTRVVITALAEQATRHAFDVANDRRRYAGYCSTEAGFRVWVYTVALNEALRLLIRHRLGEPRVQLLSADQRRVLGMRFLDHLPSGDVAGILHISPDAVRQQTDQALEALFKILGQPDTETGP